MIYGLIAFILLFAITIFFTTRSPSEDREAQEALDAYLNRTLSNEEVGRSYERYIGYLYEKRGYDVLYNGALNRFADLGRDLIAGGPDEVLVIQTKCWAKAKLIQEKHIFQLFGTTTHFKLTSVKSNRKTKAVFYTTARYSDVAKDAASVLGVELRTVELDLSYPMIKCKVPEDGEKIYYLPFDPQYDKVKIDLDRGEHFARTVYEAVEKGFRRAG